MRIGDGMGNGMKIEAGVIICYSQGQWLDILQQCKDCLRTPLTLYITPVAVGKMNSEVHGNFW